jgi:hypothetical protein
MYNCDEPFDGYLVMSTRYPMYWVKGVRRNREEAEALWAAANPKNPFVDKDDEIAIIRLDATGRAKMNQEIEICYHDCFTEWTCPLIERGDPPIAAADVERYVLTVHLRGGRKPIDVDVPRTADLISLRQSAMERFIFPQYESSLGYAYTDRLRRRWKHDKLDAV